ncbi:hypothetical protein BDZ91DRAFT_751863 [Kalaharituber pfeilii]|nr:hypothetical protein BDZ91DRAFT_751863 [Kalaharituber pfeilii]
MYPVITTGGNARRYYVGPSIPVAVSFTPARSNSTPADTRHSSSRFSTSHSSSTNDIVLSAYKKSRMRGHRIRKGIPKKGDPLAGQHDGPNSTTSGITPHRVVLPTSPAKPANLNQQPLLAKPLKSKDKDRSHDRTDLFPNQPSPFSSPLRPRKLSPERVIHSDPMELDEEKPADRLIHSLPPTPPPSQNPSPLVSMVSACVAPEHTQRLRAQEQQGCSAGDTISTSSPELPAWFSPPELLQDLTLERFRFLKHSSSERRLVIRNVTYADLCDWEAATLGALDLEDRKNWDIRYSYNGLFQTFTIDCDPSPYHEAFPELLHGVGFAELVRVTGLEPDAYFHFSRQGSRNFSNDNEEQHLLKRSADILGSKKIPDLGIFFGDDLEFPVTVVEAGFSQEERMLLEDAELWLTCTGGKTSTVIMILIEEKPSRKRKNATFDKDVEENEVSLGSSKDKSLRNIILENSNEKRPPRDHLSETAGISETETDQYNGRDKRALKPKRYDWPNWMGFQAQPPDELAADKAAMDKIKGEMMAFFLTKDKVGEMEFPLLENIDCTVRVYRRAPLTDDTYRDPATDEPSHIPTTSIERVLEAHVTKDNKFNVDLPEEQRSLTFSIKDLFGIHPIPPELQQHANAEIALSFERFHRYLMKKEPIMRIWRASKRATAIVEKFKAEAQQKIRLRKETQARERRRRQWKASSDPNNTDYAKDTRHVRARRDLQAETIGVDDRKPTYSRRKRQRPRYDEEWEDEDSGESAGGNSLMNDNDGDYIPVRPMVKDDDGHKSPIAGSRRSQRNQVPYKGRLEAVTKRRRSEV